MKLKRGAPPAEGEWISPTGRRFILKATKMTNGHGELLYEVVYPKQTTKIGRTENGTTIVDEWFWPEITSNRLFTLNAITETGSVKKQGGGNASTQDHSEVQDNRPLHSSVPSGTEGEAEAGVQGEEDGNPLGSDSPHPSVRGGKVGSPDQYAPRPKRGGAGNAGKPVPRGHEAEEEAEEGDEEDRSGEEVGETKAARKPLVANPNARRLAAQHKIVKAMNRRAKR